MTKKEQKRLDYFAATALHAIIAKHPAATSETMHDSEFNSNTRDAANGAAYYAKCLVEALGEP